MIVLTQCAAHPNLVGRLALASSHRGKAALHVATKRYMLGHCHPPSEEEIHV